MRIVECSVDCSLQAGSYCLTLAVGPDSQEPVSTGLKACTATPDVCFADPAETSIQHWSPNKAAAPGHELVSNESMRHYMAKYFLARFLAYKR